jgi:hypothetical protein
MSVTDEIDDDPVLDELERIREDNDGNLLAPDVVAAAAPPTSPLHTLFEWDDSVGGHQYRLIQARRLIRLQVRSVQSGDPRKVRTYLNVLKEGERGYRHIDEVVADDELRAQTYRRLLNDLQAYRRRLNTYAAYAGQVGPIITAIDEALRTLDDGTTPG